jgi:hypothetical protein
MALPPEKTIGDVKVKIRESVNNPNVGKIKQVELKSGPRTYRIATLVEIIDPQKIKYTIIHLKLIA